MLGGTCIFYHQPSEKVVAVAYDYPIPGFDTKCTINIRLWSSKPSVEFDFESFNAGDYEKAVRQQTEAEQITSVLVIVNTYEVPE